MRIGINTGIAVVTQISAESANMTALGDTVNLAAPLQTLADPRIVSARPTAASNRVAP